MSHATRLAVDIRLGDCLGPSGLPSLADASVDSVVTDPPAGIGFMGKDWDHDKGGRTEWIAWLASVMRECLRVLKPGGHALVWALPRTSHWTATAIEDAGFEIRDVITHHFGTGFPKSLDVSKAIDKAAGAEREIVGEGAFAKRRPRADHASQGVVLADDSYIRPAGHPLTAPATDAAKQWAGWGTALKPASEHWILARNPLIGTVAQNIQAHGTGGLNIDGCRIPSGADHAEKCASVVGLGSNRNGVAYGEWTGERKDSYSPAGRFPANVVFSHAHDCTDGACVEGCPVEGLDSQTETMRAGKPSTGSSHGKGSIFGKVLGGTSQAVGLDRIDTVGGASRFFYCAKPATAEKGTERERNPHPTVKSVELMDYLIRLVTPPGGLVLDPFAGSGTTAVAATARGWRFVGWEMDPTYHAFALKRIREATAQGSLFDLAAGVG